MAYECRRCRAWLVRTHRTALQRTYLEEVWACPGCGYRRRFVRPSLRVDQWFLASLHTRCIKCRNFEVTRMTTRDRIDGVSWSLTTRLFQLCGAPLNRCSGCRLQYHDWRPVRHKVPQET